MLLTKIFEFDSSHQLSGDIGGKNHGRLHGHRYKLEVTVEGKLSEEGIVMDASEIKKIVNGMVVEYLDHNHINEFVENPTVENIAVYIWNMLKPELGNLSEVKLWETPTINATYRGE